MNKLPNKAKIYLFNYFDLKLLEAFNGFRLPQLCDICVIWVTCVICVIGHRKKVADQDLDIVGEDETPVDPLPDPDLAFSKIGSRKTWKSRAWENQLKLKVSKDSPRKIRDREREREREAERQKNVKWRE